MHRKEKGPCSAVLHPEQAMSDTKRKMRRNAERRAVVNQNASDGERARRDLPLAGGLKCSSFFLTCFGGTCAPSNARGPLNRHAMTEATEHLLKAPSSHGDGRPWRPCASPAGFAVQNAPVLAPRRPCLMRKPVPAPIPLQRHSTRIDFQFWVLPYISVLVLFPVFTIRVKLPAKPDPVKR